LVPGGIDAQHDLIEINAGSATEGADDSVQRESDLCGLEGLQGQNFGRAEIMELMSSMLMPRIVRLEGEVFALRHQLAQLRRLQGRETDDRSEKP
jgi:hypothetical protein